MEPMRAGLHTMGQCLMESAPLRHVVASPAFSIEQKMAVLVALSERAGCAPVVKGFLNQLVSKNRVDQLPAIAEAFGELADEAEGITPVTVTSARELDRTEQETISRHLGEYARGRVAVAYEKDRHLLGGLRIQIGSRVYDSTVRNRLQLMQAALVKE